MGIIEENIFEHLTNEEILETLKNLSEASCETALPEDTIAHELEERGAMPDIGGTRLTACDHEELINKPVRQRELMLSPFLPQAGLAMIYAMRGVGKTYAALGVAWAVATGGSFLRWNAKGKHKVLYIDGEMPAAAMQQRMRMLKEAGGEPERGAFRIITPDFQCGHMPDIGTREGQEMIEEHLEGVDLVVADNISTLCRRVKENEADGWEPVQEWALSLRQRGKSLLLVHHAGRSGQARGTSRREDILDSVVLLKRPSDYKSTEGARFEVHYEKARGFYGNDATAFEARLEARATSNGNSFIWTMCDIGLTPRESARQLVAQGITKAEAARRLGVSRPAVSKWTAADVTA